MQQDRVKFLGRLGPRTPFTGSVIESAKAVLRNEIRVLHPGFCVHMLRVTITEIRFNPLEEQCLEFLSNSCVC